MFNLLDSPKNRLWQIIPKKSPILLFSDIEPIILSKVAHYSQIILNSEHIVCSTVYLLKIQHENNNIAWASPNF